MLRFTLLRVPSCCSLSRYVPKKSLCSYVSSFTQRMFDEDNFLLWSDGGKNIAHSSSDNIGGWQTHGVTLLNYVDMTSVECQSLKGLKDVNEDRIQVRELSPDVLFIGIFDGHGGSFVVDFVSNNLHKYVQRFLKQGKSSLTTALRKGFIDCDISLAREMETGESIT